MITKEKREAALLIGLGIVFAGIGVYNYQKKKQQLVEHNNVQPQLVSDKKQDGNAEIPSDEEFEKTFREVFNSLPAPDKQRLRQKYLMPDENVGSTEHGSIDPGTDRGMIDVGSAEAGKISARKKEYGDAVEPEQGKKRVKPGKKIIYPQVSYYPFYSGRLEDAMAVSANSSKY
ncbi:MAG: hypothetical protein MUD12_16750 [Spirochaetes bacterium]|jgi:hypothetical protein|nr:hypothetical protein [Spirochaetota bacterium]